MAGQFKNFNTFNKTLALLNQCPFHRNDIQGVRRKVKMGGILINLLCEKDTVRSIHLPSSSQRKTGRLRLTDWLLIKYCKNFS